jgi:hypothetical protein
VWIDGIDSTRESIAQQVCEDLMADRIGHARRADHRDRARLQDGIERRLAITGWRDEPSSARQGV